MGSAQNFIGDYMYPAIIYSLIFMLFCIYISFKTYDAVTLYEKKEAENNA